MICASASSLLRRNGSMFPPSFVPGGAAAETPSETTSVWRSPRGGRASVRGCCGGLSPYQLRASRLTDAEGGTKRGRRWEGGSEQVRPSAPRATDERIRLLSSALAVRQTRHDLNSSRQCTRVMRPEYAGVLSIHPSHCTRRTSRTQLYRCVYRNRLQIQGKSCGRGPWLG